MCKCHYDRLDTTLNQMLAQRKIKALQKRQTKKCGTGKKWSKAVNQPNIGSKYLKKFFHGQGQGEKGPSRAQMGNCPQTPKGAFALSAAVATVLPPKRQFGSCCRSAVITALHRCVVFSFNFQSQAVGCDVRT
jgi:hypothetical protein